MAESLERIANMSNQRNKGLPRRLTTLIAIAGAAALGACSLDVEYPTMIQDEDLTTIEACPPGPLHPPTAVADHEAHREVIPT